MILVCNLLLNFKLLIKGGGGGGGSGRVVAEIYKMARNPF